MEKAEDRLTHLEARIAEVESRFLAMRAENAHLRGATSGASHDDRSAGSPAQKLPEGRPMRLAVLEAEREGIRSRIRSLIEVL